MKKDETLIRSNPEDEKVSIKNDTEKPTSFHVDKAENLPKLEIPDLPPDATSLSPEELANVPVLTESVAVNAALSNADEVINDVSETQDNAPAAESWSEVCQMRISNLAGEIQSLNERLDRFEKRRKA